MPSKPYEDTFETLSKKEYLPFRKTSSHLEHNKPVPRLHSYQLDSLSFPRSESLS